MYFVDTNIFLRVLLKEPTWEDCAKFLEHCFEKRIPLFMSYFSLHSIEIALVSRRQFNTAIKFLQELEKADNLYSYHTSMEDEIQAIENCEKYNLDFDDSMQYTLAKKFDCKAIVSFDSDFDNLNIQRTEPNALNL